MSKKKQTKKEGWQLSAILLEKTLKIFVYHSSVPRVGFTNGLLAIDQVTPIGLRNNPGAHKADRHALLTMWSRR